MIRVLTVDDHPLIRKGVRHLLANLPEFGPVEEAEDAAEALQKLTEQKWDLILLDLTLQGRDGFDVLYEIRRRFPKLPVLILSMHPEGVLALRALREGASGYLHKVAASTHLVSAIKVVLTGRRYISPELSELLAEPTAGMLPHELLSLREFQVMSKIAQGQRVSDIGLQMGISAKTVSTHRARALEKMKMATNAEFMNYAIKRGLVP